MTVPHSPLFTDLYELTMMQGYWHAGFHRQHACFDLFFRRLPFDGGYAVSAGLADALHFLENLRFDDKSIAYLKSLELFADDFLAYLQEMRFTGDVYAMAEGEIVFPQEPIVRVEGPLDECQLVESVLLNIINFQSLIATKAARISREAGHDNVLEFGLRRAQGIDGALSAARAAFIGGCSSTSNVEAGQRYGIPVAGTQAHSWIMAFDGELEAFRRFVEVYGDTSILLVDTYDTLSSGVPNAITVAREMRECGQSLRGVRLDSGDLASLAAATRKMLDEAGFPEILIVASSDLDEYIIHDLKQRHAPIDLFGVGTRLVTAHGDPSFTGVYKLAAIGNGKKLRATRKHSDDLVKATLPGRKQVWRLLDSQGNMLADWIELEDAGSPPVDTITGFTTDRSHKTKTFATANKAIPLLRHVMGEGVCKVDDDALVHIRQRLQSSLVHLPKSIKSLEQPGVYDILLGPRLHKQIGKLDART